MLVFRNTGCAVPSAAVGIAPVAQRLRCDACSVAWRQRPCCSWGALYLRSMRTPRVLAEKYRSQVSPSSPREPLASSLREGEWENESSSATCVCV